MSTTASMCMYVTVRILLFVGGFMKEVPKVVMAGMADLYLAIGI
jgi:hypothetical protein